MEREPSSLLPISEVRIISGPNTLSPRRITRRVRRGRGVFGNSGDIGQTKSPSGGSVGPTNFRNDVDIDGNLNSGDIGLVKSKSGTALPP